MPVYVEYFFAPTAQAFRRASEQTSFPVRVALGSITNFSNPNARAFLDALLAYEIGGQFAPELAGRRVYEPVDLITIHYLMGGSDPANPDYWRPILEGVRDSWVGVEQIAGVWSTEEIGIHAAEGGFGGGLARRIAARYLGWISDNRYLGDQVNWFYYGPTDGPPGQRANDSMTQLSELVGDHGLVLRLRDHSGTPMIETHLFEVPELSSWLIIVTAPESSAAAIEALPALLPFQAPGANPTATLYAEASTEAIDVTLLEQSDGTRLRFAAPLPIQDANTILVWIDPAP